MRLAERLLLVLVLAAALVTVAAPAMAQTPDGLTGSTSQSGQDQDASDAFDADDAAPADQDGSPIQVREAPAVPDVEFQGEEGGPLSGTVGTVLLFALGAIAPAVVLLMTSFTRFIVVLGLAKNALALQTVPPSQVLIGLSLFLTAFVMNPVFTEINDVAIQPVVNGEMSQMEGIAAGFEPLREFMLTQVRDEDLALFIELSGDEVAGPEEVPATTLIPAYVISELRAAFTIGFVIFIPFLLIDLVVAAVLMSMGMMMVPPVFISLPLKLLLFVLVDGWVLMIGSVVQSVQGVT